MFGRTHHWKRIASLVAVIAVLAISAPHVDACRTVAAETAMCCPSDGCAPDAGQSGSNDEHLGCCALHHVMIVAGANVHSDNAASDHAPGVSLRLDSAFVPAPERPPAFA